MHGSRHEPLLQRATLGVDVRAVETRSGPRHRRGQLAGEHDGLGGPLVAASTRIGFSLDDDWREACVETYLGAVLPQARRSYTEQFTQVRRQAEAALLFGGLLEYRVSEAPLWAGMSGLAQLTRWRDEDEAVAGSSRRIREQTYQGRIYMLAVLDPNLPGSSEVNVEGRALRLDLRVLLRYERFLATFGVGLNPLPGARPVYAGGGGNMVLTFD